MKSGRFNDTWSVYRYGNKIKILYHKNGKIPDKPFEKSQYDEWLERENLAYAFLRDDDDEIDEGRLSQSVSRTRSKIFEIALCNPFEWFVTLTLDKEKRDRYDLSAFRKDFSQFVRNENKKRAEAQKIEYLLIPEQHSDGAWHMHGLFKGLTENDFIINKNGYFEWLEYSKRFGFFSCSRIKSHEKCSAYITKYVTKDIKKSTKLNKGQHSYFASQGLKRREPLFIREVGNIPFIDDFESQKWDFENDFVKICWCDIDENGAINFGE